jgi:hypothetical protein
MSNPKLNYFGVKQNPPRSNCIGAFGLNPDTKESRIREVFSAFGVINKLVMVNDPETQVFRGYCFIYYESIEVSFYIFFLINLQLFYNKFSVRRTCDVYLQWDNYGLQKDSSIFFIYTSKIG